MQKSQDRLIRELSGKVKFQKLESPTALYDRLAERFPFHVIRNTSQHQRTIRLVKELSLLLIQYNGRLSASDKRQINEFLSVHASLLHDYEKNRFLRQAGSTSGQDVLAFLMDQHGLRQEALADELGGQSVVSDLLSHKRDLNKRQIEVLSRRFGISPAVFFH